MKLAVEVDKNVDLYDFFLPLCRREKVGARGEGGMGWDTRPILKCMSWILPKFQQDYTHAQKLSSGKYYILFLSLL